MTLAVLAALTASYRLGHRASDWARWLIYGRRLTRRNWQWWLAQVVALVEIAGLLLTHPVRTASAWKHRNDPPPPLSPPVRVRDLTGEQQP
ncbi:hypothetical protein [Streptomyces sp. NPDC056632]|uniref:hypothetical protein n=1 Tax=Streptomyces sp. NPDC056632 TaxID=3345884 RepID=UPI0036A141BD